MAKLMKDFIRIENNFTIIPNDILKNKEMKSSTKNILLTMFGLPSDWDFSIAGIATCVYEGYETVQKALVELEKIGYITRKRDRRDNGTLGAMIYTVHQFPVSEEENTYKNNFSDQDVKKPKQEKTNIGKNQYREKPVQDFKRQLSNDNILNNDFKLRNDFKTKKDNTLSGERAVSECKKPEPDKPKSKSVNRKKEANTLFEQLWSLYPLKKGKGSVSDTQKAKLLEIGYEELERAISRYVKYVDSVDYLHYKNGSTFFNSGYIDYLDVNYEECGNKKLITHHNGNTTKSNTETDYKTRLEKAKKKAAEEFGEEFGQEYWEGMSDLEIESHLALMGIDV